jgi:hypothetical protein
MESNRLLQPDVVVIAAALAVLATAADFTSQLVQVGIPLRRRRSAEFCWGETGAADVADGVVGRACGVGEGVLGADGLGRSTT